MKAVTLSVRVDAGIIGHNNRTFVARNVNADKISDNIIYVQKDLKEAYKEIFSEALEKYNAKQKRSDRIIKDYYEHIKNSNKEKLFYETVIQFGNIDTAKVGTEDGERAKEMLNEYMKDFEKRNPNFKVFNAVMHLDESTPHLHIDFIPVAYNQSQGKYISIKPSNDAEARAVRTKTLGDEYTEENLIKRIADKYSYVKKTEEKIKSTTGIEKEFYIGVQKTVTVIFAGDKIPKKYNPAKGYSINNDWHINELATQINVINREHINSAAELENLIEKSGANILEQQNALNEITEMQSSMRDVISKAEFYFANKDKRGDAMLTSKLAAAKETLDKFNITLLEDLEPLKIQYGENLKELSKINTSMTELQKRQSAFLKLQETHQALISGNYIDNLIEKQKIKKEQDLK